MNITIRKPIGYTHTGRKPNQEDAVWPVFSDATTAATCITLCDGVGGSLHGEVASHAVSKTIGETLTTLIGSKHTIGESDVRHAVTAAYDVLDSLDSGEASNGVPSMATTLCCVCLHEGGLLLAHMGDSRIYVVRPGKGLLYQSADHSLVNSLLQAGELTPEEARDFPHKNVITRALQPHARRFAAEVHPHSDIQAGDYIFICSDGVLEQLTNQRLVEILSMDLSDSDKLRLLEAESTDRTRDNFTAYLIPIDKVEGQAPATQNTQELVAAVAEDNSTLHTPNSTLQTLSPLRILLINTSDSNGGAAIAARRLLHALVKEGHEARMLVRDRTTGDTLVERIGGRFTKAIDRARIWAANGFRRDKLWWTDAAYCGVSVTTHPLFEWADVIHLHWVGQGMLSMGEIERIMRSGKRVVWTMHDLWPVTGICHHPLDCKTFHTQGCGYCPQLCRPARHDLSAQLYRRKAQAYANAPLTFVACSQWLATQARHSALTQGHTVLAIPNTIDTQLFKPHSPLPTSPRGGGLEAWGGDSGRLGGGLLRILFSSANVRDERKGMAYLLQALGRLQDLPLELVVLGQGSEQTPPLAANHKLTCIPYLSDPGEIARLNASVHLFVTPSLQENLPNTIMEAMACGTPCVGFSVGGIPEMIDHLRNGYVARLRDAADLANGIRYCLTHHDTLSPAARQKVLDRYSPPSVVAQYLAAYSSGRCGTPAALSHA